MRPGALLAVAAAALLAAPPACAGARIVQTNEDGWAELHIRTLNDHLRVAGHSVALTAPADDRSRSGSRDERPRNRSEPCHYDSCAAPAGLGGANASRPDLRWVNSFPVTAMRFGLRSHGPRLWDGAPPDLALVGPSVGSTLWLAVRYSGAVGAACFAANREGVPAVVFSAASDKRARWDVSPVPRRSLVYAQLAAVLTDKLVSSGKPYLPRGVFLNVNFPEVNKDCASVSDFKWILSRINPGVFSKHDVPWCRKRRLPTEQRVADKGGCYISVSMGDAADKTTVNDGRQQLVLNKLRTMLTCLP